MKHKMPRSAALSYPIIAHSHLSWDWVWQRPQQFLSRLSRRHRTLFVEVAPPSEKLREPESRLIETTQPNLTVLRMQFPMSRWSDGEWVDRRRRELVHEVLKGPLSGQFDRPVQWFYDPMAAPAFIGYMDEQAVVYDCMDELSQFKHSPKEILERERELLLLADVVFTGGRKLYHSKKLVNPNCHFYGCGVEVDHFEKAMHARTYVPDEVNFLHKPVLGYFGVVDERLDYGLIASLADANPYWSVVIIGPRIKVEEADLPRRKNLHWLGKRDYADLPAYCKAFDVCLMPFALNAATEYINPTKALEYMATGRPIVSTAVPDVVSNFSGVVKVARGAEDFVDLCRAQAVSPDWSAVRKGQQMARENTWDAIVAQLEVHVDRVFRLKPVREVVTAEADPVVGMMPQGDSNLFPRRKYV